MIAPHLLEWARRPGPSKVLAEVRDRLERGRLGVRAKLQVELSSVERAEVGQLADVRWTRAGEPVRVDQLRGWLAANGVELESLVEAIGGPMRDLPEERRAAARRAETDREAGRAVLRTLAPGVGEDVVAQVMRGAESWEGRAREIERVVVGLAEAPERLPALAARLFADSHALDRSRSLGRAVARFLAACAVSEESPYVDPVADAAAWREAWASRGVVCDAVSAQVLVLNLPVEGESAAAKLAAVRGEPVWLSLRSLAGGVALADGVPEVFVCENPAIVEAAADLHGAASAPLVCTYGFPNLATMTLLEAIAPRTTLRVRADGDAAGWRIVGQLLRLPGAVYWRMEPDETRYEEELLSELLQDLANPAGSPVVE